MAARRIVAQSMADRGEDGEDKEGEFTRDQLTAFFEVSVFIGGLLKKEHYKKFLVVGFTGFIVSLVHST